jgi:hypothetical protein
VFFDGQDLLKQHGLGALLLQTRCLNAPRPDREHHRLTNDSSDQRQKKRRKKAENKDAIFLLVTQNIGNRYIE